MEYEINKAIYSESEFFEEESKVVRLIWSGINCG
jgi:hypothetical protein